MVLFTFCVLDLSDLFCQIWSKNQTFQFKLKLDTKTNLNMQNSMVLFTFFYWKHPSGGNLVQKIKIVSLSSNLVPKVIRICRIQWYVHFLCFIPKTTFFVNEAQLLSLRPDGSRDFEIGSCRQHGFFILLA